jgi:hypothetical protein
LQAHFDNLNNEVNLGNIKINDDLSISDLRFSVYAVYGSWTYHWWGYDRKFTNSQAISYANSLNSLAAGIGMTGAAASAFMPIVGAGIVVSGGYYALLSSRVTANNTGKGVYVGMTWARIFNVYSL